MKAKFRRKEFLNMGEGDAICSYEEEELRISDCYRKITLSFQFYGEYITKEELENSEYKLDLLYEMISEFRKNAKKHIRKTRKDKGWDVK